MKINYGLKKIKIGGLALGFFDGVHIAHQELIKKAVGLSGKSGLLTFLEAPLKKNPLYLTLLNEKIELIEKFGIDEIFILNFDEFKNIKASEYIDILIKYFSPDTIITGFNHTFGANKTGGPNNLINQSAFKYVQIPPVKLDNLTVSSSRIKNLIENGEIKKANLMLGYEYQTSGNVIKGNKIARKLGYRTANLIWNNKKVKPNYGVYKGNVEFEGQKYKGLINFGIRPSIDKELKETLEVHLLNFNGNLYGKTIKVVFIEKIRNEIKFNSFIELKSQIDKDFKAL